MVCAGAYLQKAKQGHSRSLSRLFEEDLRHVTVSSFLACISAALRCDQQYSSSPSTSERQTFTSRAPSINRAAHACEPRSINLLSCPVPEGTSCAPRRARAGRGGAGDACGRGGRRECGCQTLDQICAYPAGRVLDAAALVMRAVAEGGANAAAPMREAALSEGALLHHLAAAVSGQARS